MKLKKQTVRECDFVNISNYSRPKKGTSPKVSSFTEVTQNINTLPSFQDIVEELVRYNLDLFAEKDKELGNTQTVKMKIDMLAANVIQPSRSTWSFPIYIVDKKDDSKRFCTDFRKLNLISKKLSWPLPVIDNMLAVLGKAEFFTTLDLKIEYWQITADENDKEKTALTCHEVIMSTMSCLLG